MKKLLIVLLALAMIFAMAACAPAPVEEDVPPVEEDVPPEVEAFDPMDVFMGGKYYMEITSDFMGMETLMKQAVDGENTASVSESAGIVTHSLMLDGLIYTFDDAAMTYYTTTVDELGEMVGEFDLATDYADMVQVDSGNGPVPGLEDTASYDYVEYALADDMELTTRFYVKDDQLYAIYTVVAGMEMTSVVNVFTSEIPEGFMEVPAGYTEVASPLS